MRRNGDVIARTLASITGGLETALFAETLAGKPGLLQRLDPRTKILSFLALILATSLSVNPVGLVGLYALALLLACAGQVPLGWFVKRVWVFMPFFTGVIAIPALFNLVTPGQPVLVLASGLSGNFGPISLPADVSITEQGLRTASFLVLRVADSVSFGLLLVMTTPWAHVTKALRVLHVPQIFILILAMTHRYVFLLLHTATSMLLARESRRVGRLKGSQKRRWLAGVLGSLMGKSYHLSNEVYLAMLSRGFQGEPRLANAFRMRPLDYVWLMFSVLPLAGSMVRW
ncbi:MAG: cobalt ECF transporter T component CbiQ [Dehalococcoidia bacterium]|nr:cobalt ECF transporter T component CbiQ [Dehalococcoidia bacterium]